MAHYTVVVPLDGSELSEAVLPVARTFAQARGGQLLLTRIAPSLTIKEIIPPDELEELMVRYKQDCQDYLDTIAESLRSEGLPVNTQLAAGDQVADQILAVADMAHADLIAMSTHGRSGLQRLMIGSVADKIVHHATVPVLLVRPGEGEGISRRY
jgi:nucleotide-binding universal stress UspA family protein